MTTKDEALKMAIEYIKNQEIHLSFDNLRAKQHTLQACIEALEQPAQEPIHNCPNCNSLFTKEIYSTPEPSWQGLSDDEIDSLDRWGDLMSPQDMIDFARAIEQALRNKNDY